MTPTRCALPGCNVNLLPWLDRRYCSGACAARARTETTPTILPEPTRPTDLPRWLRDQPAAEPNKTGRVQRAIGNLTRRS